MKPDFGKRIEKYKDKRTKVKRKELRTIRLIAVTVATMIKNNSKTLTNKDLENICIRVYGKVNKIKKTGVYQMVNTPAIKEEINNKLLDYYIKQGIEPISKVFELTNKAEEVAKNTSDYMQIAKHYKEIAEIANTNTTVTQKETIDYASLADSDQLIEQKRTITRTVTKSVSADIPPNSDDLSNNDK